MSHNLNEGHILGLGNPLLDISAVVDHDFLRKYGLEPNNAIIADEKHENLCRDLTQNYRVDFIAGGAAQNTIRVVQWFCHKPRVGAVFGAVGRDEFGKQMKSKAEDDQVIVSYYEDPQVLTGTCACLITGNDRSLCAYLGASQQFNLQHVHDNLHLVEQARIVYTTGFHLMVCFEAQLFIAQHVHDYDSSGNEKCFTLNISAPFVPQTCSDQLDKILPYVDILFGNESEAQAFARVKDWDSKDIGEITQKLADIEHRRPRMVVITQGCDDVLVAFSRDSDKKTSFKVHRVPEEHIVDTIGAGDTFVGGFLAYKALGKPLEECIDAGIYAAHQVIKMAGCTFPKENIYRL